jgi:hypothetical protein
MASSGKPNPCDAANLNLPSIALPTLAEGVPKVFFRTVTNVLNTTAIFTGTATIDQTSKKLLRVVSITPTTFTLAAGASQLLRIEVVAQQRAQDAGWMFGSITWRSGKGTKTRIPLAAKVAVLRPPFDVTENITALSSKRFQFGYTINPGVTGQMMLTHTGLKLAQVFAGTASTGEWTIRTITISENTSHARFAVYQADLRAAGDATLSFTHDVDLYVANNTVLLASDTNKPDEQISMVTPSPGTYEFGVFGINVAKNVTFHFSVWLLSNTPTRNMRYQKCVPVTAGTSALVGIRVSRGLEFTNATISSPPTRYLGRVVPSYGNLEGGATVVTIAA